MIMLVILFIFTSGLADGLAETLKFHYYLFVDKYPNSNNDYWDLTVSWRNKYKNGDPAQGPKFFGATTFLVWVTDGYHLSRFIRNQSTTLALLSATQLEGIWEITLLKYIGLLISYQIGFTVVYDVIFKK